MIRISTRLLAGGVLALVACGGTEPNPPVDPPGQTTTPVASVTLAQTADTVIVKDGLQLAPVLRDSAGAVLASAGRTITYASSNQAVATVSSGGLVTAQAIGEATITVTAEGRSATMALAAAPQIAVGRPFPSLFAGDTTALAAALTDRNGAELSGTPVWISRSPAVATVDANGVVCGLAPGRAWVVATLGAGRDSQEVVVHDRPGLRPMREFSFIADAELSAGGRANYLYAMRPDGTGHVRLSAEDHTVNEYAWAPAGDRMLITYTRFGFGGGPSYGRDITVTVAPDGTDERVILATMMRTPRWSPDASRVVYFHANDLYSVASNGSDVRRLTTTGGDELHPAWSPDGRQIAFIRQGSGVSELWVMAADGSGTRHIPLPEPVAFPRWSADGKSIVVLGYGVQAQSGWQVGVDGSNAERVPFGSTGTPSPDGGRVLRRNGGTWTVSDPDGGNLVTLPTPSFCSEITSLIWSPDGTKFSGGCRQADEQPWPSVFVMNVDGTGAELRTDDANASPGPWRP